ncbi:MAG TPA: hypothetical protein VN924_15590 [Bryobacteraceae bacterium]|nr:hypothetical protein [Bryobacteraceae bacterium]
MSRGEDEFGAGAAEGGGEGLAGFHPTVTVTRWTLQVAAASVRVAPAAEALTTDCWTVVG